MSPEQILASWTRARLTPPARPSCPSCSGPTFWRGHDTDGEPRLQCKRCRKTFRLSGRKPASQSWESRSRGSKAAQASIDPEVRRQRAQKAALARWAGHQIAHPCPRCGGPTQPYENRKRICKSTACRRAQRAERKQRKESQCQER